MLRLILKIREGFLNKPLAPVVQWTERGPSKPDARGSNPLRGTYQLVMGSSPSPTAFLSDDQLAGPNAVAAGRCCV